MGVIIMQVSEDLIRQTIDYLKSHAFDSTGQALHERLQFILKADEEAEVKDEGDKYRIDATRPFKVGDLVRNKLNKSWTGRVKEIKMSRPEWRAPENWCFGYWPWKKYLYLHVKVNDGISVLSVMEYYHNWEELKDMWEIISSRQPKPTSEWENFPVSEWKGFRRQERY